jgi:hypothetical protein
MLGDQRAGHHAARHRSARPLGSAAGENGPVVVPLTPPDASGVSSECAEVSRELAKAIMKNPENYYVNVHTSDFSDDALRGQLP